MLREQGFAGICLSVFSEDTDSWETLEEGKEGVRGLARRVDHSQVRSGGQWEGLGVYFAGLRPEVRGQMSRFPFNGEMEAVVLGLIFGFLQGTLGIGLLFLPLLSFTPQNICHGSCSTLHWGQEVPNPHPSPQSSRGPRGHRSQKQMELKAVFYWKVHEGGSPCSSLGLPDERKKGQCGRGSCYRHRGLHRRGLHRCTSTDSTW